MAKKRDIGQQSIALHKKWGGKISVVSKARITTKEDLALAYTPGVGAVSSYIAKKPSRARDFTIQHNTVAVISDGSAVLGLGNIGPEAALPVLEGKAALFKTFADVDAFPIALNTQDVNEIVETVIRIAPTFGGINLEDISAPRCFEVEARLKKALSIPVMHDDQHGTAIVVLAGLINAFKITKKDIKKSRIVIVGAGAAGVATAKLLYHFGVRDIVMCDSRGVLSSSRRDLNVHKQALVKYNKRNVHGDLNEAMYEADAVIGVSGPKKIVSRQVAEMRDNPIVFALANPVPEIFPEEAQKAGARIIATGRSDYPNQVNNSLVFPGVFRGAFDHNVRMITDTMKVKAAQALAHVVKKPHEKKFIPGPFDRGVVSAVSNAIR
ncbi:MAG TPA: NADP-dependent malic enzyme [Candidatus Paceibacterota bacterium]